MADNRSCAVSATGWGEYFLRVGVAKAICDRRLLLGDAAADKFLAGLGFDVAALVSRPHLGRISEGFRAPLALTGAGRYRKAVLRWYELLRRELEAWDHGS